MTGEMRGTIGSAFNEIEETLIAALLGLMTILTFVNVLARYVFNTNILWALEVTVFMFAWMVLLGASYCFKKSVHLGVDVAVSAMGPTGRKVCAFLAVLACLAFSLLLLKGSWDYWYPFITKRAFLETEDVPMPEVLQFLSTWLNEGEAYEKMPRFIPYFILPLSMTLMVFRVLQLGWRVVKGEIDLIIASHEAETEEALEQFDAAGSEHGTDISGDSPSNPSKEG